MSDAVTTQDVGLAALGILLITVLATSPLLIGGWLIGRVLRALKPLPEIQEGDDRKGKRDQRTNHPTTGDKEQSVSHSAAYSTSLARELGREEETESWDRERRRRYGRHQHKHAHRHRRNHRRRQNRSAGPLPVFA